MTKSHHQFDAGNAICLAFVLIFFAAAASALDCIPETESLFEMQINVTRDTFHESIFWQLRDTTSPDSVKSFLAEEFFSRSDEIHNTELCIPKSGCFAVRVQNLPLESHVVKVDGVVVPPGPSFPYFTSLYGNEYFFNSREFGDDCVPECQEEDAVLFELDFNSGQYGSTIEWRIENRDGEEEATCYKLLGWDAGICDIMEFNIYHERRCLSREQCYRLILGDRLGKIVTFQDLASYNVSLDGNLVVENEELYPFALVELGGNASSKLACGSNESLFELFLWRTVFYESYPDITWAVLTGQRMLLQGNIAWNDTKLSYFQGCVPADECLQFSLSVPETFEVWKEDTARKYAEWVKYRISLDGVVFFNTECFFHGNDTFGRTNSSSFEESQSFGECAVFDLCNKTSEILFDMSLEVGMDISAGSIWRVWYMNEELYWEERLILSSYDRFETLLAGTQYRTYQCIPTYECSEISFDADALDQSLGEYIVFVNGVEMDGTYERSDEYGRRFMITCLGGENCPIRDLSAGAIAGIVIGAFVAVAIVGIIGYKFLLGRHPISSSTAVVAPDAPSLARDSA
jgi:hypothetical protein